MPMTGEACDVAWRAAGRPVGAILAQRDATRRDAAPRRAAGRAASVRGSRMERCSYLRFGVAGWFPTAPTRAPGACSWRGRCAPSPTATWRCCCRRTCSRSASARSRSASSARRRCSARRWRRLPSAPGATASPAARLLRGAALLMVATGVGFAGVASFWPLLVVAFVGTLNPSSGDVSVFLPLEHARLAHAAQGNARVALFARYSVLGALFASLGALAAAVPDALGRIGVAPLDALRAMFVGYGAIGLAVWLLYRRLPAGRDDAGSAAPAAPLGPSRAHRRSPRGAVQRRRLRRRPGRQLAARALAVRALRLLADAGGGVLLLDRPAQRRVAACRAARRRAHRPAQHDGLHAPPGQRLPGAGGAGADAAARARLAVHPQRAVADGRADAHRLRDGRRHAGRAHRRGELHRRAAQPGGGPQPDA